jgi:fructoselysine 6-kinase
MTRRAISVGDNCIDNYVRPVQERRVGGNAVNVAVHMRRGGVASAYLGAVGDDQDGRWIVSQLRAEGVDVSHVHILPGRTARSDIALEGGERHFLFEDFGVGQAFRLGAQDTRFIAEHDLAHWSILGPGLEEIANLHARGVLTCLDYSSPDRYDRPFLESSLPGVDIAFFSAAKIGAPPQLEAFARKLLPLGPRLIVLTRGEEGSMVVDRERVYFQAAVRVPVVDTLGAGDAFIGLFLARFLLGDDIQDCLSLAAKGAAQVCTHLGAWQPRAAIPPGQTPHPF